MQKLKEHLLEISLIVFSIKAILSPIELPTSLLLISLIISIVYTKYFLVDKNRAPDNAAKQEIEEINKKLNSLQLAIGMKRKD